MNEDKIKLTAQLFVPAGYTKLAMDGDGSAYVYQGEFTYDPTSTAFNSRPGRGNYSHELEPLNKYTDRLPLDSVVNLEEYL